MNEYDSELIKSILKDAKYSFVKNERDADIVMLNTCAIREKAHRKIYGRIQRIHHDRAQRSADSGQNAERRTLNADVKIGILGCMATNLRQALLEDKHLKIDFIAGPDSYKRLPQLISESFRTGEKQFDLTLSEFETYSDVYPKREGGVNAWVAVMRGCNNFCTFCVVPYTRGRERSRSPENVVDEVKRIADEGVKQVTLLGQNVNSYKYEDADFADLLEKVSKVKGIERIRFTSPHPKDFPEKLLMQVAENPKVCKHIHLPLQSGNDRILDLMSRSYTQKEFFNLVDKTRALIPGVALTTDIIIGFCTEEDDDFKDTIDVMKHVKFDSAFIFKYSQRKQTIASNKYRDDVPEAIKTERIVALNELQNEISFKKNKAHIGEEFKALIEAKQNGSFKGRLDSNKTVSLNAPGLSLGQYVVVKINDASIKSLKGELLKTIDFCSS